MKTSVLLFLLLIFASFDVVHRAQAVKIADDATAPTGNYDLSVHLLPDRHRIEVDGTWELPPVSEARATLEFYLSPKMQDLHVVILEPKIADEISPGIPREEGGDIKWTFPLKQPLPPWQVVKVGFSYSSENMRAPQFNISPEGSFAGGGGELWYPQSTFKDRETGTLHFLVPVGDVVISNGIGVSTATQKAAGDYTFHVTRPSKFGFASGKYKILKPGRKVPFELYLLNENAHASEYLEGCTRSLSFLTTLFGHFPYNHFSLVEIDFGPSVAGTSEFGFILADESEFKRFDLSYWAHEIGHQWWGDLVRSKSGEFGQMMFSEGITQFGALKVVEAIEGADMARSFKLYGYRGIRKAQSAKGYFELVASNKDLPLALYKPKNQDEILLMHRLANSKGFIVMDMLNRLVGPRKFAGILRRFVTEHANKLSSWKEFETYIERYSGNDIRWFFEQWFERTGAPRYELTWIQNGASVRGRITQPEPYFRANLEVELQFTNGRRRILHVDAREASTAFELSVPSKVQAIVLDPDYKILRWLPEFGTQH